MRKSLIQTSKIGPLECTIVGPPDGNQSVELAVVLCHGFGAPGTDLVPLAEEILGAASIEPAKVAFVFPAAPLVLEAFGGFEGRAWWMINMQGLAEMMETNDFSELRTAVPPGIIEAREMLNETLDELFSRYALSWDRLILGGFSQGAMLTTDTVFHADRNPLALIQMSGTMVCENQWREKIRDHRGLKVLQSHGTIDPVLPYQASEWLRDLFVENGCDVKFLPFHGVHTIPMEMLEEIKQLIEANL